MTAEEYMRKKGLSDPPHWVSIHMTPETFEKHLNDYAQHQTQSLQSRVKELEEALRQIKLPLRENPNLNRPKPQTYYHGYRSATLNIIGILEKALNKDKE